MPREMPRLDRRFGDEVNICVALARVGESIRDSSLPGSLARRELHAGRLEALYEFAYLRMFIQWESFLEQAFVRYLCGYRSRHGQATMLPGRVYCSDLGAANVTMLGGQHYILWHNPLRNINLCRTHFSASAHERMLRAAQARLENFAAVRHRIAHGQEDAKSKFDNATMTMAARRYPGSRAGRFLRDWDSSRSPRVRWLESIGDTLRGLAGMVV
jgi:hypothetical protein